MTLNKYEIEVLRIMLISEYSASDIENIILTSTFGSFDFTGAGYFLEISNDLFPVKRKVISEPFLIGKTKGVQVGFVLFLENKTLTIECHSWGIENPPEDIRSHIIEIEKYKKT
jgi:hypothetical protein